MTTDPVIEPTRVGASWAYERTSLEQFLSATRAVREETERRLIRAERRAATAARRLAGGEGLERLLDATLLEVERTLLDEERVCLAAIDARQEDARQRAEWLLSASPSAGAGGER